MKIRNNRLEGEGVEHLESPNHSGPFEPGILDTIVVHFTDGGSADWAIRTLTDPQRRVSSHLVVARDGRVFQMLPFNLIGWHAGESSWGGRRSFNKFSIGIEIDNAGLLQEQEGGGYLSWFGQEYPEEQMVRGVHRHDTEPTCWHRYTDVQLRVVEELCGLFVTEYGIRYILGHEEIAPNRKIDPGPAFPLDEMRERVLWRPLAPDCPGRFPGACFPRGHANVGPKGGALPGTSGHKAPC